MEFDAKAHLGAVARSVSVLSYDGKAVRAVTLARSYNTTVEDLWDAVTNGERIPRWFSAIDGELELGGRYQLAGNAGGRITECEPRSHFALTWEFGDRVSWVNVRLVCDEAGHARLALTHSERLSQHWHEYGPGATGVGWEMGLLGLANHIAQPAAPLPDAAAFATSPDGKALIIGSSDAWGEAAIAAGEEAEAAREAARRTTAFYCGDESSP